MYHFPDQDSHVLLDLLMGNISIVYPTIDSINYDYDILEDYVNIFRMKFNGGSR